MRVPIPRALLCNDFVKLEILIIPSYTRTYNDVTKKCSHCEFEADNANQLAGSREGAYCQHIAIVFFFSQD